MAMAIQIEPAETKRVSCLDQFRIKAQRPEKLAKIDSWIDGFMARLSSVIRALGHK
jgi:hypothetical protein